MNRCECQTPGVRAGRLVSLMLILQRRGRATAAQLADELEVSQRTILQPLRVTRSAAADDDGWIQATFRIATLDAATTDVLSLSPHVEVLEPCALRDQVAERLQRATALYPT